MDLPTPDLTLEQARQKFLEAEKRSTPGNWRVRSMGDDCFVERPRIEGEAYGVEILGDEDYKHKRGDAEFITAAKAYAQLLRAAT